MLSSTKDMVHSYIWSRNETQPFGGFIWIFVYVLAAKTSADQEGHDSQKDILFDTKIPKTSI